MLVQLCPFRAELYFFDHARVLFGGNTMLMNLEFQEAARLLAQQVTPVNLEYVPLTASLGRILGETV
ncbi:MAG: hypothetical protein Q4E87_01955, partial [bacterium]|nr:hypothetical protein [bacterium]